MDRRGLVSLRACCEGTGLSGQARYRRGGADTHTISVIVSSPGNLEALTEGGIVDLSARRRATGLPGQAR